MSVSVPFVVVEITVYVNVSPSGSAALTFPVTDPVVALGGLRIGVPTVGELLGGSSVATYTLSAS